MHVRGGRPVIVFHVCGNTYRLIAAMHSLLEEYDAKIVKWPKMTGLDVRKHLLEEQGMCAALSRPLGGSRNLQAGVRPA